MRFVAPFNSGWVFHEGNDRSLRSGLKPGKDVVLPHNAVDLPYSYLDETSFQKPFTYQKSFEWRPEFEGRQVSLVFDGAMADSVVFLNGMEIHAHPDGYTPFEVELTKHLRRGENLLCVVIDGFENPQIPPFGGQIDYLTYAGIYRDVWLKCAAPVSIERVRVETREQPASGFSVSARCDIRNSEQVDEKIEMTATLRSPDGTVIARCVADATSREESVTLSFGELDGISRWDLRTPVLYSIETRLECMGSRDQLGTRFGFRSAEFRPEGFFLNGRRVTLRGLNRHQSLPYVGYAAGRRAQERDAEILKHELKCNLVRTAHYPQSPWFLDHCDRVGLLVFEEIPGWQHIGGADWKRRSLENLRAMIQRDWNHPSIILWGTRINESPDDHEFYARSSGLARALDPSRQTGGVRNFVGSELLEDVYTVNDFVLGSEENLAAPAPGINRPRTALRSPRDVTGLDRDVPYLVTEFNGHMFPTKRTDPEERQVEHVLRHLEVLDAAYGSAFISGCIGWCMADYNTHKDFGSGERICHHGVLDMFREPKPAAFAYASQDHPGDGVVMKPVTCWARGERSVGGSIPLVILTNCDAVEFRLGDGPARTAFPDRSRFPNLPHPPVIIDHRHVSPDLLDCWGKAWYDLFLTGILEKRPVCQLHLVANPLPARLEIVPDSNELIASEKDLVRVAVRVRDQAGNVLVHFHEALTVQITGAARLVGPRILPFRGGSAVFWLESTGKTGTVLVEACTLGLNTAEARLHATGRPEKER